MAIGTTAALIGGSVLGVGSSILSSNATKNAASRAADAAQDSTDAQIALARETRDGQIARSEPFRQLELQQGNALGEIYGFNAVSDTKPQPPQQQNMPPYQHYGGIAGGTRFSPDHGGFAGGAINGVKEKNGFNDYLAGPQLQGRPLGGQAMPQATQPNVAPSSAASNGINRGAQDAARARFEGSMFNDVYRNGHARDIDRIDAGLGASGLAFSGARMQAVEDARADRFGSTFNSYFSGLMGQAPQSATHAQNSAAGTFGANAGSAIAANGQAQQQSAYQRGQANAGLWNNAAGLGGYIAGGGFSKPTI